MEYYKLVAVTGLPGLYELITSKKDGAIVRSLQDKSTRFASTRIHQFSHLESIEIYTTGENKNLVDIFHAMEAAGKDLPDTKDDKAVKAWFQEVYPDLDFDRVYNSDMKKIVKWFDILKKNEVEIKLSDTSNGEEPVADSTDKQGAETEELPAEETSEKKPAKKAAAKKAVAAEGDEAKAAPKKAAAKKKAPAKKKAE